MTTINTTDSAAVSSICAKFVAELTQAIRQEAVASVISSLATGQSVEPVVSAESAKPVASVGKRRGRKPGVKYERRDPAVIADMQSKFVAHVKANPGQRMEEISKHVGIDSKTLAPAVKQALESNEVTKEGQKRATTYSATVAAPVKTAAKKRVKKPAAKKAAAKKEAVEKEVVPSAE